MDKLILKILLRCIRPFAGKSVDFEKLTIIAETKIRLDNRRAPANSFQRKTSRQKNPLHTALLLNAIVSIFIALLAFGINSIKIYMILLHAYLMVMMIMTIITDFSAVMLDTADNQIILPKPVNSKTVFWARLTHILVYLTQFCLALTLIPWIAVCIHFGIIPGIATLFTIILTTCFSVFFTYLFYILIIQCFNEQKIKDIIGFFQIAMTMIVVISYQILPQMVRFDELPVDLNFEWYHYLLPPVWMAMSLEALYLMQFDDLHLMMLACTILIPICSMLIIAKYLAPNFSKKLLNTASSTALKPKKTTVYNRNSSISAKLSSMFCKSQPEKSGFELVWKITSRDKGFKIHFYPSLGYILVFIFVMLWKSDEGFAATWANLPNTNLYLWLIYIPVWTIATANSIIPYSSQFNAAWIYQISPIAFPGNILTGSLKAVLCKFFLPIFIPFFLLALYIWGPGIVDDFVFGLFNNLAILLISIHLNPYILPFSQQPNLKKQSGKFVKMFAQFFVIAFMIAIHYFSLKLFGLIWGLTILMAVLTYFLYKKLNTITWSKITV